MTLILKSLSLFQFRNYQEEEFHFGPTINLIHGANAQGKTNLLEALFLLSTGRSFRTPHLSHLILEGKSHFFVEATFSKNGVTQLLKVGFDGKNKKINHNQTEYSHFTPLFGLLPTVLLTPDDVDIISGPPSRRRKFLDLHIAQHDPLYVYHLIRYYRALKQRNALLKARHLTSLSAWEEPMAVAAAYLTQKREEVLLELNRITGAHLVSLSHGHDAVELIYQPSHPLSDVDLAASFIKLYHKWRPKEISWGVTLVGPHKDDFTILLNQKEAKLFSSEGQKRSCSSALKMAEVERLSQKLGVVPLVAIDDVTSHLDPERQTILLQFVKRYGQLFITSPSMIQTDEESFYFEIKEGALNTPGLRQTL